MRSILLRLTAGMFLVFALAGCSRFMAPPGPIQLADEVSLIRPGRAMEYCADPSGDKTLREIQSCAFQPVRGNYPSFGSTSQAVWLRFEILPDRSGPTSWYFELATALPRSIKFFRLAPDGAVKSELHYDSTPPAARIVPHQYFILPLENITAPETVYLRAQSDAGLNLPVFLWNKKNFPMRDLARSFAFAVFFGVMFAMTLYNLFLFVSIRDRAYLYYVLYILFVTEFFALVSGYAVFVVPDSWVGHLPVLGPVTALLATIFALLFARKFLMLKEKKPRLAMAANVVMGIHVIGFISVPFVPIPVAAAMGNIIPFFGIVVIVKAAVSLIQEGFYPAKYFLTAWSFLMIGVSLFIAQNLNVLPAGFFTQYAQFFGASAEAVLLSLALGYRINSLRAAEQDARRDLVQEQMRALAEQKEMTEAFSRFVPREFLDYLNKPRVVDIVQGDVVRKEMAVLFLDIRGFTRLSESLGSEATFAFLNRFHGGMEPVIQKHGGFIDKFIGDAIMALFPDALSSVRAAVEMQRRAREEGSVRIGAGLHFGELMLGTVGSPRRLETTVIGDTVNLASRMEGINKLYGTEIIISDSLYRLIQDSEVHAREVDAIRVKGKTLPVVVYEILDVLPPEELEQRLAHMPDYMAALLAFRAGDFERARAAFSEYLVRVPGDSVAQMYIRRLESVQAGTSWDGIWEAESK